MLTFFQTNQLTNFKQIIQAYLKKADIRYHHLELSPNEYAQLALYEVGDAYTPEARDEKELLALSNKLHFEAMRGLARRYAFELLLRGDEASYKEFIRAQKNIEILPEAILSGKELESTIDKTVLTREAFDALVREAQSLDEEIKNQLKISCLLTISNKAKAILKENGLQFSEDSEDFLSQLPQLILKNYAINKQLFPLTKDLTEEQLRYMIKMYWPTMHFRHMLYTEGGINMTASFVKGIKSGEFTRRDFIVWKWRWLINLMGFKPGLLGKYFNQEIYQLSVKLIQELEKFFTNPEHNFLDSYLLERAAMAGLTTDSYNITLQECKLLGHIAASFNEINILTPELGKAVYTGYAAFQKEWKDNNSLPDNYAKKRNDTAAVTHTYVPAVLNTAFFIFKNNYNMDDFNAVTKATQFMSQFLNELYKQSFYQRISCMDISQKPALTEVLKRWLNNPYSIKLKVVDQKVQIEEIDPGLGVRPVIKQHIL